MSVQNISENLKHLIKLHDGISILELSKKTQIPQPTLHHILSGETKKPRAQALEALATFFCISIDQLVGTLPLPTIPSALKENLKISTVPVIDWIELKNWPHEINKNGFLKEIIIDQKISQNSFALIMKDSSLEPLIPEKSMLIFDAEKIPKDRDFVVVYISHSDTISFNRLFIDGKEFYLKQNRLDGSSEFLKLNLETDHIMATLIEVRLHF